MGVAHVPQGGGRLRIHLSRPCRLKFHRFPFDFPSFPLISRPERPWNIMEHQPRKGFRGASRPRIRSPADLQAASISAPELYTHSAT